MCGIVGALSLVNAPLKTHFLKKMADSVSHRGPDDAGYLVAQTGGAHNRYITYYQAFTDCKFQHISPMLPAIDTEYGQACLSRHSWNLYFGHRRLAILDTSGAGHQPLSDLANNIWLCYNGEIYNFNEIRSQLQQLGYEFVTNTDTEVIVYAYKEWGIKEIVSRFNGMFAFAIWDREKNLFFLARDRYGIKPLYFTLLGNGTFLFASEVKAILQYEDYKLNLNIEALIEYFTFQNLFTDKTFYQDVKMLAPGNYLAIDLNSSKREPSIYEYWDFNFAKSNGVKDGREYVEELDRLFNQAVSRQMVSDVEIGSYLSGGMDSGSIAAIASQQIPYLKTFTIGFDMNSVSGLELAFDERQASELLSYKFRTEHYEMVLKSGDMERCLPDFAWHLETPRVGQSYPNYYAAKLAGKFVKVVLSGAGGDELFGGYPWRYYRAISSSNFEDYIDKYYLYWQRLIDNRILHELFEPIRSELEHVWTRDIFRSVFKHQRNFKHTPEEYVNHSLYFEAKTFLHGLLVVEDHLSMAHSLETRVPFLDNDIVDFAMQLPVKMKLANIDEVIRINENNLGDKSNQYFKKTSDGKLILRKALAKYMPDNIVKGVKQGFSSPDQSWFKKDAHQFVHKSLLSDDSLIYSYFSKEKVEEICNLHFSGKENKRLFIWSLLNFNQWLHNNSVLNIGSSVGVVNES